MSEAVTTTRGRGRPPSGNPKPPKSVKEQKVPKVAKEPKAPKLKIIEPEVVDETVDLSGVIDDFDTLRSTAAVAMGEYALEARNDIVAVIKAKRTGTSQIHYVHPLDLHVLVGEDRINTREFANDDMRLRQIEFGNALLAEGIQKPLVAFIQGERLVLVGGETRLRSVLHLYVRGLVNDPKSSKVATLPLLLEKSGTNDFDRALRVATDNDQKNLKPIEVAANIKRLLDLAESQGTPHMDAMQRIADAHGKTVTYVYYHLKGMELPSEVIGLLRHEPIDLSLAMTAWKKTKENPVETIKILRDALEISKASGARKVMPKHSPDLSVVGDTSVETVETVDTDTGDTVDTGVSTGGVVDTSVVETEDTVDTGVEIVTSADATEAAIVKATALLISVLKDSNWNADDSGFVNSRDAEWPVEEFLFIANTLGFRIPAVLESLVEDGGVVAE